MEELVNDVRKEIGIFEIAEQGQVNGDAQYQPSLTLPF